MCHSMQRGNAACSLQMPEVDALHVAHWAHQAMQFPCVNLDNLTLFIPWLPSVPTQACWHIVGSVQVAEDSRFGCSRPDGCIGGGGVRQASAGRVLLRPVTECSAAMTECTAEPVSGTTRCCNAAVRGL